MRTDIDTSIFKSYDVRGIVPAQLNDDIAYAIGRAFVEVLDRKNICIGRDMRPSGEAFIEALSRGANDAGADVTQVGLISTDAIYFAVGHYGFDGGIMITASHNPAQYNGFKFCREEAIAISIETGLAAIRDKAIAGDFKPLAARRGTIAQQDILDDFAEHCLSFIDDVAAIKPFKIAIDAGNGMAGATVPRVFEAPAVPGRADVFRTRRHVSESSGQPDRAREHGRPAAGRQGTWLRSGRRVRRRCRPHVPRRRDARN